MNVAGSLVLLAALVSAACSGDSPAGAGTTAGTYTLVSAQGTALPATVFDGHIDDGAGGFHFRADAVDGVLTLAAGGRYTQQIRHARYYDGVADLPLNLSDHGTWTQTGSTIHLSSDYVQNVEYTGTIGDGTITLTHDYVGEGQPAVYHFRR
jgi:hypothetical protein